MSLNTFGSKSDPNYIGSMLFSRGCSGSRVVTPKTTKSIGQVSFPSYGAHLTDYPCAYITVAASVGVTKEEIDTFTQRLDKTLKEFNAKKV